jgi:hypothetical protein
MTVAISALRLLRHPKMSVGTPRKDVLNLFLCNYLNCSIIIFISVLNISPGFNFKAQWGKIEEA